MRGLKADLKARIISRMSEEGGGRGVWTPTDFLNLGDREAVDQALHRLSKGESSRVCRITRGLYELRRVNVVSGATVATDYMAVIDAIARRDRTPTIVEEVMSDGEPNSKTQRVIVSTRVRLKPLHIGNVVVQFVRPKKNAPKRVKPKNKPQGEPQRTAVAGPLPREAPVKITGGGGHDHDDRIAARFMIEMLAGTNQKFGADFGKITRIDWQARGDGWLADDLALTFTLPDGGTRSAGISVKSNQQVTATGFPSDFVNIAWSQWLGSGTQRAFRRGVDVIVLATGSLPRNVHNAWSSLSRQIHSTSVAPERIPERLSAERNGRQSSAAERNLFQSFRPSVSERESETDVVRLLRDVRLFDYDFNEQGSRDEAEAIRACQDALNSGDPIEATQLWARLIGIAAEKRPAGGSIDLAALLSILREQFRFRFHPDFRADWDTLTRLSAEAVSNVQSLIANTAGLPRTSEKNAIRGPLAKTGVCFLAGESGSGKSALVKEVANSDYARVVWLTSSALDCETTIEFEQTLKLRHPFVDILQSCPDRCVIVFDELEKFSERAMSLATKFARLSLTPKSHVHLIFVTQFAAADRKLTQLTKLEISIAKESLVSIPRPTERDVQSLLTGLPQLRQITTRPAFRQLLTNLKVLDWVARLLIVDPRFADSAHIGLTTIVDQLWEHWADGPGAYELLTILARTEAEGFTRGVQRNQLSSAVRAALPDLVRYDLVTIRDDERVSFVHDLVGDWARMRILVGDGPSLSAAARSFMLSPRWQQAARLFGQWLLEHSDETRKRWLTAITYKYDDASPDAQMRDLFLDSLFLATNAAYLINLVWAELIADDAKLLKRLLHRFLLVATLPDSVLLLLAKSTEEMAQLESFARVPFAPHWLPMIEVLYAHRDEIARYAPHSGAKVCNLWLKSLERDGREQAAALAVVIAREVQTLNQEHRYFGGDADRAVYEALLRAAPECPDRVVELCLELAGRRELSPMVTARVDQARLAQQVERDRSATNRKPRGPQMTILRGRWRDAWPDGPQRSLERSFRSACLDTGAFSSLVQASSAAALEVLLAVSIEEPDYEDSGSRLRECGLAYWPEGDPAAYFRGPFLLFLRTAPNEALAFILRLTNFATSRYAQGREGLKISVNGDERVWYGDSNVFRWHHDWPLSHGSQVQSGLMALEQWLYEQLDQGSNIEPWVAVILAESESLAFAGLLLDVGKHTPSLFRTVLRPLFFTWQIWDWDFQITTLRHVDQPVGGYWGNQPALAIAWAKQWYELPHRKTYLLTPDGPIARTMLSDEQFASFFADVRSAWSAALLPSNNQDDKLHLLIERINPTNYTFDKTDTEVTVAFQWPETIARANEEQQRRISAQQQLSSTPWRCRKFLDAGARLADEDTLALWNYIQNIDANPPEVSPESGEPTFQLVDAICGGLAVILAANPEWLFKDPSRQAWCRSKLQATIDEPPPRRRFDSELSVGNSHWDSFAAEAGVSLLAQDTRDRLARQLVGAGLTAFNYNTTAKTMSVAARKRNLIGSTFDQMTVLAIEWAGLRPSQVRADEPALVEERESFTKRKQQLLDQFVGGTTALVLPDVVAVNAAARAELDRIYEKRFPESVKVSRRFGDGRSRETLHPTRLGIDARAIRAAFCWLDIGDMPIGQDRARWLAFILRCLHIVLTNVPAVAPGERKEIDGLPEDFDDWVFQLIARTIPRLTSAEKPEQLWRPLLDRGAPAHQWVERFFWHWFTDGYAASENVGDFVRLWHAMITYAHDNAAWDPAVCSPHELDSIVVELSCFDPRWNAIVRSEGNAVAIGSLKEDFAKILQRWGKMPKVANGFAHFVIQPGAKDLLVSGIVWLRTAIESFDKYDWKYGVEESVTEYLAACWLRESPRILNNPATKEAFLAVLTVLVSRGSHAALALRDRVAA